MDKLRAAQATTAAQQEPEHELWRGSYSPKAMYGGWFLAIVVTLAAIVLAVLVPNPAAWIAAVIAVPAIWLALLLTLVTRRLSVEYTLTTQRFLHKRGLLRRVADQILLVDVDDISYEQGILGRMLNFGTITLLAKDMSLHTKDSSNEKLTLVPVDNVQHVANLIDEARREERRKRAIYTVTA
ncbi:MAG TPA: PH domain-containing protein [Pirellulaceae bacterium]|nr:PH domain-containing protein [Pirellulaceae bacterium]